MSAQDRGHPVAVGIDGSESALVAVRWAAAEAERRNVRLRLVAVFAEPQSRVVGGIGLGADSRKIMLGATRTHLAEATASAKEVLPAEQIEQVLISGFPIPVLRAESRAAQVLVLGDRGYGVISGLLLGSVVSAMAAQAECPIVLVRPAEGKPVEDRSRPVVVGVDGSPLSGSVLAFAYQQASVRGVPLIAVHTWWDMLVDPEVAPAARWDATEAHAKLVLAEQLAGWSETYNDVRVHRMVTRERPARALIAESRRAQLVVVGSWGIGVATALLRGSVCHAVLHRSRCSVAVVRVGESPEPPSSPPRAEA
jgi:nucleotide-binding universal stress UspA family protein